MTKTKPKPTWKHEPEVIERTKAKVAEPEIWKNKYKVTVPFQSSYVGWEFEKDRNRQFQVGDTYYSQNNYPSAEAARKQREITPIDFEPTAAYGKGWAVYIGPERIA